MERCGRAPLKPGRRQTGTQVSGKRQLGVCQKGGQGSGEVAETALQRWGWRRKQNSARERGAQQAMPGARKVGRTERQTARVGGRH